MDQGPSDYRGYSGPSELSLAEQRAEISGPHPSPQLGCHRTEKAPGIWAFHSRNWDSLGMSWSSWLWDVPGGDILGRRKVSLQKRAVPYESHCCQYSY
jgi:hypothetical protein